MSVSRGIHILRQLVPLVVVGDRDIPVFQYGVFVSPRYICLALLVDVVYVYEFVVVVDVAASDDRCNLQSERYRRKLLLSLL